MRRREFITLLGTMATWPLAARTQPAGRAVRIGYIGFGSSSEDAPFREAFREGLRNLGGLVVQDHAFFLANADAIAGLAASHRISSICSPQWAASGGLMGYGVNFSEQFRRAAVFVDKILKGANPGDIPVEQATKFVTIINLKAARAFGVEMPAVLLARADKVIE